MLAGGRNSRCNPLDNAPFRLTLLGGNTLVTPPPIDRLLLLHLFPSPLPKYGRRRGTHSSATTFAAERHAAVKYVALRTAFARR